MSKARRAARPLPPPASALCPTTPERSTGARPRGAPRAALAPTLAAALLFSATGAVALRGARGGASAAAGRLAALPAVTVAHATRDDLVLDERLVPPPSHELTRQVCVDPPRRWVFPGATREGVAARLTRALRGAGRSYALAVLECDGTGCGVEAPSVVVESVEPAERPALYAALAASPLNPAYAAPFRRRRGEIVFHESPGLPPEAAAVIARTTWSDGAVINFADLSAACEHAHNDDERRALILGLHRPTTVAMALRTGPESAERLVASVPLRLRGALRSALAGAYARGEASIPVEGFFPPEARRRLRNPWAAPGRSRSTASGPRSTSRTAT